MKLLVLIAVNFICSLSIAAVTLSSTANKSVSSYDYEIRDNTSDSKWSAIILQGVSGEYNQDDSPAGLELAPILEIKRVLTGNHNIAFGYEPIGSVSTRDVTLKWFYDFHKPIRSVKKMSLGLGAFMSVNPPFGIHRSPEAYGPTLAFDTDLSLAPIVSWLDFKFRISAKHVSDSRSSDSYRDDELFVNYAAGLSANF